MTHNPHTKRRFLKTRSLVVQAIRDFFVQTGYLEVETPLRCPSVIPEAHIEPLLSETFFLQASPEMCMKRLLSEGFDKIFQICKSFRKDERGEHHLPEFTLLEWYTSGHTYLELMDQCFELVNFLADRLNLSKVMTYQGKIIHLSDPWPKIRVMEAFEKYSDIPLETALEKDLFEEIVSFKVEPKLGNSSPTFLCDYPAQLASLAKILPDEPDYAQRFEMYIAGLEIANGFTELVDPDEQKKRFQKENSIRESFGRPPLPMPDRFLKDLEAMPEAAGIALGLDRLVMFFCDTPHIGDVIAVPPEML